MMEIDSTSPQDSTKTPKQTVIASWITDAGVSELSDDIFSSLQKKRHLDKNSGEVEEDAPTYEKPQHHIDSKAQLNQHIHFNLIHHRGANADIPILKLIKSFTTTIKKADPSAIILPFHSNEQHYSSLSTNKHIQATDDNKMSIYFKSYHQCQLYLLSEFFHISSKYSFMELQQLPLIDEWLDTYRYFLKLCPSQNEEMVQIGALCYSSVLMFRDDLKQAIYSHPLWQPSDPTSSPIFDIYIGDLALLEKTRKFCLFQPKNQKWIMMALLNHIPMVP
jgi:hypothetical protein